MIEIGMTIQEAAHQLNGREYRDEVTREFERTLKENNLIAIFGASDDLTEFRGVIHDEAGLGKIHLLKTSLPHSECDDDSCPYYAKLVAKLPFVETDHDDGFTVTTTLQHAKFTIMEDGEPYGQGIVIYNFDLPASL